MFILIFHSILAVICQKKNTKKKNPYDLVKLLVLRIFEGKIEMCPILLIICGSIDRMI